MKILLLILCCYIYTDAIQAQPYIDIAGVQGMLNSADKILNEHREDVDAAWFSAHASYPHVFRDSSVGVATGGFETWNLAYNHGSEQFQTAYLALTWLIPVSDRWKVSFTAIPRFNGDAHEPFRAKTFQPGGAVIASYAAKGNIKLKGGLYYNKEFFGNYFLPLAGIDWKVNDRLYIFGLLPNNFFADWTISPTWHAGFIYKGITTSFRLGSDDFYDYYMMEEGQLKIFADIYLMKNLVLNVEAGHTLLRHYGYGFLDTEYIDQDLKDAAILQAGIFYRMWVN